jgi:hypothetical protein
MLINVITVKVVLGHSIANGTMVDIDRILLISIVRGIVVLRVVIGL